MRGLSHLDFLICVKIMIKKKILYLNNNKEKMTKKISTILLLLLFVIAKSQNEYSFSVYNNPYEDIENGTSITNDLIWYDFSAQIPIGFNFELFGESISELYIHQNVAAPNILTPAENYVGTHPFIIPFGASIVDRAMDDSFSNENEPGGQSNISYIVDGEMGSRIFKMEYNNIGFEEDIWQNGSSIDFVNFQLWFYEDSNVIEIHFGSSNITNFDVDFQEFGGPFIWLIPALSLDEDGEGGPNSAIYSLIGNAQNPELIYGNELNSLTGMPQNGTVYRFNPQSMNVSDVLSQDGIKVYPNPTTNHININTDIIINQVVIVDSSGKIVETIQNPSNVINLSTLKAGIYYITITYDGTQQTHKVIKK